jgi:hypothetical protein
MAKMSLGMSLIGAAYIVAVIFGFSVLQWNQTGPNGF